jgi:hypothetical protein
MSASADGDALATTPAEESTEADTGTVERVDAPDLGSPRFGIFSILWSLFKHHKRRKRKARKGYIKWFLVGSTWPAPRYVKPEPDDGGQPAVRVDGQRYLFPQDARTPSVKDGMWTVIHRKGEAEPIDPRANEGNPLAGKLNAATLDSYARMAVTSTSPSLLAGYDKSTLMRYGIFGLGAFLMMYHFLGPGLV